MVNVHTSPSSHTHNHGSVVREVNGALAHTDSFIVVLKYDGACSLIFVCSCVRLYVCVCERVFVRVRES